MKQKEFDDLPINAMVKIKGRLAKKTSHSQLSVDGKISWAYFEYLDTHRKVTKRYRQVEKA